MTIQQLLECPVEELEKFTDLQMLEFFSPSLKFVRPPEQPPMIKEEKTSFSGNGTTKPPRKTRKNFKDAEKQLALLDEICRKKGIIQ